MATLPQKDFSTVLRIDRAVEEQADRGHRQHLGCSVIGQECPRALWYIFRHVLTVQHPGRILRLFARGQREEQILSKLLRGIGCQVIEVDPTTGNQFRFSWVGGHLGGSMDAGVLGVPEAPKTWHVAEYKTSGDKPFKKLCKEGVKKAKPEHWSQMNLYMKGTGMKRALYLVVNKNDDTLYAERLEYDEAFALQMIKKAERIITAQRPPEKISEDPSFFKCKWCDFKTICHGIEIPEVGCRTCLHSTPETDQGARWTCARHGNNDIPFEFQSGPKHDCDKHLYIPDLLNNVADQVDAGEWFVEYVTKSGQKFRNGATAQAWQSSEIRAVDEEHLGNEVIGEIKDAFDGRVIPF